MASGLFGFMQEPPEFPYPGDFPEYDGPPFKHERGVGFRANQPGPHAWYREPPPSLFDRVKAGADWLGRNTLGAMLALGTADPRLPQTQDAYDTALGVAADFTPVVNVIKAAHDANQLRKEGHPLLALAVGATAGPWGTALKALGKSKNVIHARHYGPGARADVLDPSFHGTGYRGAERRRKAAFPDDWVDRTYFYTGDRRFAPEPPFRSSVDRPGQYVDVELPADKYVNKEQFQEFVDQAREQLAEGRYNPYTGKVHPTPAVPDLLFNRTERLLKEAGFEGYYDDGILVKFTPTVVPSGATGRGIRRVAEQASDYVNQARGVGRQLEPHPQSFEYAPVSEERGRQIADVYDELPHAPDDPVVAESYQAMAEETRDQYNYLTEQGVKFEPAIDDPYASSAEMIADVRENNRLKFFLTDLDGFPADHPLAQKSGVFMDMPDGTKREMVFNDLFRAVHDYFGHAAEGFQFGARGEDNAWRVHSAMYSPEARRAMSFETRGQNSWTNFGPQMRDESGALLREGDEGFIPASDRAFAEQKANILPDEFVDPNMPAPAAPRIELGTPRVSQTRKTNAGQTVVWPVSSIKGTGAGAEIRASFNPETEMIHIENILPNELGELGFGVAGAGPGDVRRIGREIFRYFDEQGMRAKGFKAIRVDAQYAERAAQGRPLDRHIKPTRHISLPRDAFYQRLNVRSASDRLRGR